MKVGGWNMADGPVNLVSLELGAHDLSQEGKKMGSS